MSGVYTVYGTNAGCNGVSASTTVVLNATPSISSLSTVNPSICGGSNGSISLNGLTGNTTYVLNYDKNSVAQAALTLSSNNAGQLTISNLTAGTYGNIVVSVNGCNNLVPAGPVTLSDPGAPTAPSASNNGPVCSGGTFSLTAGTVAGATYSS
jgi:VCBS repeat-containing protein